jgi:hypothetical protein
MNHVDSDVLMSIAHRMVADSVAEPPLDDLEEN